VEAKTTVWVPLAALTAVAFALEGSYAKALSKRAHVYVVTWAMMALVLPWAAAMLVREGVPEVQPGFYRAALVSVALNMVGVTLEVKALSVSPLSLTVPFLAFTPLFMIATSFLVLHETPDVKGLAGIVLVTAGAYAINLEKIRGGFLGPIKAIAREPGSRLMLLVALLWSVSAVYDKVATVASSPSFYSAFFAAAFGVLYAPALVVGLRKKPVDRAMVPRLFLIGFVCAVMVLSQFAAVRLTLASYVIAVKRSGMLLSVVLGRFVFGERSLAVRLLGAALMIAGVVTLSL
jgi:drug/metabolite transporter (DMT)-like permease